MVRIRCLRARLVMISVAIRGCNIISVGTIFRLLEPESGMAQSQYRDPGRYRRTEYTVYEIQSATGLDITHSTAMSC